MLSLSFFFFFFFFFSPFAFSPPFSSSSSPSVLLGKGCPGTLLSRGLGVGEISEHPKHDAGSQHSHALVRSRSCSAGAGAAEALGPVAPTDIRRNQSLTASRPVSPPLSSSSSTTFSFPLASVAAAASASDAEHRITNGNSHQTARGFVSSGPVVDPVSNSALFQTLSA